MTLKKYLDNPYQKEFNAEVIKTVEISNNQGLILDQTCFFAKGGGQPSDLGTINDIPVLDVISNGDEIIHIMSKPVNDNSIVGKINWIRRFDHMQQHTGQHILSQCLLKTINTHTLHFHMENNFSIIEINYDKGNEDKFIEVELLANKIVYENKEIKTFLVKKNEIANYPLRKAPNEKFFTDQGIRVANVGDFDYIPCGGTHCLRTGEVGLIKIKEFTKKKKVHRLKIVCGKRAFNDYATKSNYISELSSIFKVDDQELVTTIKGFKENNSKLEKEIKILKEDLLTFELKNIISETTKIGDYSVLKKVFSDKEPILLKKIASEVTKRNKSIALLGTITNKAYLIFSCSKDVDISMKELIQKSCSIIDGSGGGSLNMAQGGGNKVEKIAESLDSAIEVIVNTL